MKHANVVGQPVFVHIYLVSIRLMTSMTVITHKDSGFSNNFILKGLIIAHLLPQVACKLLIWHHKEMINSCSTIKHVSLQRSRGLPSPVVQIVPLALVCQEMTLPFN